MGKRSKKKVLQRAQEALNWPVVKVFIPRQDCWSISGFGTAGVIRQRPNGRWCYTFYWIGLINGGLENAFGKDDSSPEEFDRLMADLTKHQQTHPMPPMQPGTIDQAAEYIWGAYALSKHYGYRWPSEVQRYLSRVPQPSGSNNQWSHQLLTKIPSGLAQVIRKYCLRVEEADELPSGKELAIFTRMTFRVNDHRSVRFELERSKSDFTVSGSEGETIYFNWTRKYPKGHWSPLSSLRGRQIIGDILLSPDKLIAETKTLSFAGSLVTLLKDILQDRIELDLTQTTWTGWKELVPESRDEGNEATI